MLLWDLTGSGNETSAHLYQNSRITIIFCSFTTKPLILRICGQDEIISPNHSQWQDYNPLFSDTPGKRQIVLLKIQSLQTSCGFGVPLYEFQQERETLIKWAEEKGESGIKLYWEQKN